MSTINLVANTNFSALTVANNDTINLTNFTLTFDTAPTQTGVTVDGSVSGSTNRVALGSPTTYTFTNWIFKAGAGPLLSSVASGKTINGGSWRGGNGMLGHAIATNSGTINNADFLGGSFAEARGLDNNSGALVGCTVRGGTVSAGCGQNNGTLTNCVLTGGAKSALDTNAASCTITGGSITGGTGSQGYGVGTNSGVITALTITGGTAGTGVNTCDGTGTANACTIVGGPGGSGAPGINTLTLPLLNCTITGGASTSAHGVTAPAEVRYCTITGGSVTGAPGIYSTSTQGSPVRDSVIRGGSGAGSMGIGRAYGPTINCDILGGTGVASYGIKECISPIINLDSGLIKDNDGRALYSVFAAAAGASATPIIIIQGNNLQAIVPAGFYAVYPVGPLNTAASVGSVPVTNIFDISYARQSAFVLSWNVVAGASSYKLFNGSSELPATTASGTNRTVTRVVAVNEYGKILASASVSGSATTVHLDV